MLHIKVPATSANMGSGFDSIGVALQLYNHLWVEEISSGLEIEIKRKQEISIPTDEHNLIYKTIRYFYEQKQLPMPGVRLIQEDFIPMVRGLGSSAACIVGGLVAANELAGRPCDSEELAQMASRLEGHPDNATPAIFGSMVVGAQDDQFMKYARIELKDDLLFAIMIPDFPMSTAKSRGVLPDSYSRAEAVFNISRSALLVASMLTGKYENLEMAVEDKIHQPYRSQLIPGMDDIFDCAKKNGALACYLSGAGSTLMAIIKTKDADLFENSMSQYLATISGGWKLSLLKPDKDGAMVESE